MKKAIYKVLSATLVFSQFCCISAYAQTNGYGAGNGREDNRNVNDYSTSTWDRFWYNYEFESGVDYREELGNPTTTDMAPYNPETQNIRRNKDVSFTPPPYGVFSGDMDTERSNPYVTPDSSQQVRETTDKTISYTKYDSQREGINGASANTGMLTPTSLDYTAKSETTGNTITINNTENTHSSSQHSEGFRTEALLYSDGSIGTLKIPKLGLNVKIYEGESLSNLKKGIGHFEYTSAWDGNVCLAAHNGGSAGYFEDLKDLKHGDEFIYETKYGTRIYTLSYKETISDTDYSLLGWSNENTLTMITCVKGVSDKRLAVIAVEK